MGLWISVKRTVGHLRGHLHGQFKLQFSVIKADCLRLTLSSIRPICNTVAQLVLVFFGLFC